MFRKSKIEPVEKVKINRTINIYVIIKLIILIS